jgi:hypothetical protein
MLSTFRACPKKFYWQYILHLKPMGFNIHLSAGAAYAAALDAIRKLQGKHDEPLDHETLFLEGFEHFLRSWQGPLDLEEHPKNIHNMLNTLELYLQEFHPFYDDVQPFKLDNGNVTSEFSFALPLPIKHPNGDPFIYVGRFDMLAYYKPGGFNCIYDDKTTGSLGPWWLNQFDMRGQFLGYIWACQQLGYDINSAIVRGTGILKTETKFLTHIIQYEQHMIDRWFETLCQSIEQLIHFEERDIWPYNFADSCSSYGGCPMKTLCEAKNPESWYSDYEVRIWNPVGEARD